MAMINFKGSFFITTSLISFFSMQNVSFASNAPKEDIDSPISSDRIIESKVLSEGTLFNPGDLNGDGKVNISDTFIFIGDKIKKLFIKLLDINEDGVFDWNDVRAFLDFNGNGKLDLGDVSSGINKIINGAHIALDAFTMAKDKIASNGLFNLLSEDSKNTILSLLDKGIAGAGSIANHGEVPENFKGEFLSRLKAFRDQLKSGELDKSRLTETKDTLINFLKIADKWEATGNSSKWISQIKKILKNI